MASCNWCDKPSERKLCEDCYKRAISIPALSVEERDDLPYGVIELDADGKILAFNNAEERQSRQSAQNVIGKNFFRDVAPCTQVKEYAGRFKEFLTSDKPSTQFSFTYVLPHGRFPIHIMLVRARRSTVLIVSKMRAA
jgi:photoactive yellow protein